MLLFILVARLKFLYACEMAPWVSAGLILTSPTAQEAHVGNRLFIAAEISGASIFGTFVGALTVSNIGNMMELNNIKGIWS